MKTVLIVAASVAFGVVLKELMPAIQDFVDDKFYLSDTYNPNPY